MFIRVHPDILGTGPVVKKTVKFHKAPQKTISKDILSLSSREISLIYNISNAGTLGQVCTSLDPALRRITAVSDYQNFHKRLIQGYSRFSPFRATFPDYKQQLAAICVLKKFLEIMNQLKTTCPQWRNQ